MIVELVKPQYPDSEYLTFRVSSKAPDGRPVDPERLRRVFEQAGRYLFTTAEPHTGCWKEIDHA